VAEDVGSAVAVSVYAGVVLPVPALIGRRSCVECERLGAACADVEPGPVCLSAWDALLLGAATGIAPLAGSETEGLEELLDSTRAPAVPTESAAVTATNAKIRPSRRGLPSP
jgi:hypothetical protein